MITQCDIPVGGSYVYHIRPKLAGTYWYHAHKGISFLDGLYGALIIESDVIFFFSRLFVCILKFFGFFVLAD